MTTVTENVTSLITGTAIYSVQAGVAEQGRPWLQDGISADVFATAQTLAQSSIEQTAPLIQLYDSDGAAVPTSSSTSKTAFIAIPSFLDEKITAVTVLILSRPEVDGLAFEWWSGYRGGPELAVEDAFSWGLERFKDMSTYFNFPHGAGLPGLVWKHGAPITIENLGEANPFMRTSAAISEGLDAAWAIPVMSQHRLLGVFVALTQQAVQLCSSVGIYVDLDGELQCLRTLGPFSDDVPQTELTQVARLSAPAFITVGDKKLLALPHRRGDHVSSISVLEIG